MAINTRTEYAIRALLEIMDGGSEPVSTSEICKRQLLPKKYIEHLLAGLKAAGYVHSTPGSKGGYLLATAPEKILLYDVMHAVEDTAWEPTCNINDGKYCMGSECGLQVLWQRVSEDLKQRLNTYNLKEIHKIRSGGKS